MGAIKATSKMHWCIALVHSLRSGKVQPRPSGGTLSSQKKSSSISWAAGNRKAKRAPGLTIFISFGVERSNRNHAMVPSLPKKEQLFISRGAGKGNPGKPLGLP